MTFYVTLEMPLNTYNEVIENLEDSCSIKKDYSEMENLVHLIDALQELREEDANRRTREDERWREQKKILYESIDVSHTAYEANYKYLSLFRTIQNILKLYDVKLGLNEEAHLILDIIDEVKKDE